MSRGSTPVAVHLNGKVYPSQAAAARALKRSIDTIKRAVLQGREVEPRTAAWGEISRRARERGLEPMTVHNRMNQGRTLEEALALPQWVEIPAIAARVGPKSTLIREAVASGMTLERALLEMPLRDRRVA